MILKDQMYSGFGAVELMASPCSSMPTTPRLTKYVAQCTLLARTFEHCRGKFYSSWMLWGNSVRWVLLNSAA